MINQRSYSEYGSIFLSPLYISLCLSLSLSPSASLCLWLSLCVYLSLSLICEHWTRLSVSASIVLQCNLIDHLCRSILENAYDCHSYASNPFPFTLVLTIPLASTFHYIRYLSLLLILCLTLSLFRSLQRKWLTKREYLSRSLSFSLTHSLSLVPSSFSLSRFVSFSGSLSGFLLYSISLDNPTNLIQHHD